MPSSPGTRKRPAPSASPLPAEPIPQANPQFTPQDMMRWNGVAANGNSHTDLSSPYMVAQQSAPPGHAFLSPSPAPTTSNALALRDPASSRALIPTAPRSPYDGQPDQWGSLGGDGALIPLSNEALSEEEHLRILLERARKIEEEATKENPGPNQKRSIPPFVLKLSSFLNNGRNSDLIRWSEKGDSFIVLDEEEFAKKLIPEMFKHNNYASFVRQLNMYGFHKRVGLSDNSMRASEKKNKSPSEYAHPYFLRAHPVLQWLITKPNKAGGKKRQKQANKDPSGAIEQDSDAEDFMDDPTGQYALSDIHPGRNMGRGEAMPLAKTEMGKLRDQLAQVQQKQQQCLALIQQLQNNQHEIVQRAQKFEEMHHRHENSITAILNFLANVFRKSLEENGGAQNISDMLASILPQHGHNHAMPTGSVQDLSEYLQQHNATKSRASPSPTLPKRPQHLLPGIPGDPNASVPAEGALGLPASPVPYPSSSHQAPRVTEVFDTSPSDTTSPIQIRNELQSNPEETMLKIMGETNARMTPGVDLPEAAAATSARMPSGQRNKMVNNMSRRTATPSKNRSVSPFRPPTMSATPPIPPAPSGFPTPTAPQPATSLSPILNTAKPPSIQEVSRQQNGISQVEALQRNIGQDINSLAQLAAPLSPNGQIMGIDGFQNGGSDYFGDSNNSFDFNQYLDTAAMDTGYNFDFNDLNNAGNYGAADGTDFDFSLPNADYTQSTAAPVNGGLAAPAGAVPDTPSPAGTEEIQRPDLDGSEQPATKRRRQG
ncbi:HSF-type DNA-binding protein [Diaporthe eres]|uniref:HSF-type DNA-binding domain-containing protein n=1 Tax=Diaporthe vaccinii TaxID=105482 RepID=A0ABR4FG28_9PEZI|nr:HSF-type DNA-binding protein [Diaporthe eres]